MYDYKVVDGHLTDVQYDGNDGFNCSYKQLTSLKGCPKKVNGIFKCSDNQLTTLEGSPKEVNDFFSCSCNPLTTLKGCPEVVKGAFICAGNKLLEDISDLPESVNVLWIGNCLKIKIFPRHIKDTLRIYNMSKEVYERLKQQPHLEIVEEDFNYYYNEYKVIIREKSLGQQILEAI